MSQHISKSCDTCSSTPGFKVCAKSGEQSELTTFRTQHTCWICGFLKFALY
uniref:Uncharacterized protein n=1 Tax=Anguilla anguilla TaxID=7936 RepID=A0A0E9SED1_ANGAN